MTGRGNDGPGEQIASTTSRVTLPPTFRAPMIARRHLQTHRSRPAARTSRPAVLATNELITNAVIHGQPNITPEIQLHPAALRVSVVDTRLPAATRSFSFDHLNRTARTAAA